MRYNIVMQTTTFEKEKERMLAGHRFVIGVDEVGRGPLAGPVVACAVTIRNSQFLISHFQCSPEEEKMWNLIRDSKTLSEKQREKLFDFIHEHFHVGIGIVSAETIDRVNILEATFLAMKAAVSDLLKQIRQETRNKLQDTNDLQETEGKTKDAPGESFYCLIDGNQLIPNFSYPQEAVVGGDGTVKSIAAASIVAKVTRDRMMDEYETQYPGYGFAKHKGYGTKIHMDALRHLGPCPIHRMSFKPVSLSIPENVNKRFSNVLKPKRR